MNANSINDAVKNASPKEKVKPQSSPPPENGGIDPKLKESLMRVSDAQYDRGFKLVQAASKQSLMRGINDAIDEMLDSDLNEDELDAIAAKFSNRKRIKPHKAQVWILPASEWKIGDEEIDGPDDDEVEVPNESNGN
ncbi:hypothetical protein [Pseudanabaena sp. 'Roaring Creek']|uniref:hypothetical protein n=1 Tax=Pseudanabaena sp. 'Roaring Creek' TaxID=1681830 RepID=UPI0006D7BD0B|nr:hypothetical protein [Pseudanabaena sp. 'Roaring Creek']